MPGVLADQDDPYRPPSTKSSKCIDTFCYGGGWLTALDVRNEEVWQADREGRMRSR